MAKQCKTLGSNASKLEIETAHKVKMGVKKELRRLAYESQGPADHVFANLSQKHEFWGDTPQEHFKRKHTL